MAERRVAEIVGQRHRLAEILVEPQRAADGAGDLRHLERMGEPRAVVVALVIDEDLRLVLQPPERRRMDDAVAVALERAAAGRFRLGDAGGRGSATAGWHRAPAPRVATTPRPRSANLLEDAARFYAFRVAATTSWPPSSIVVASGDGQLFSACRALRRDEIKPDHDHQPGAQGATHQLGVRNRGVQPGGDGAGLHHFDQLAAGIDLVEAPVARHHLAGDPADQGGADQAEPWEAVEDLGDQRGADDDDGDRDHQADHDQGEVAPGRGGDGDGVVEAHHRVGDDDGPDRGPDVVVRLDVGAFLLLDHQLDADPEQQRAAHQLEVGHGSAASRSRRRR